MFAELKSRAIVRLSGPETRPFLQGLLSNDVTRDGAIFSALLSPQGKILFDLLLLNRADDTLIDCEAARADELVAKLKLYRLRARIDIARLTEVSLFAEWQGAGEFHPVSSLRPSRGSTDARGKSGPDTFIDPRLSALGARAIGPRSTEQDSADEAAYTAHRLAVGVPESAAELGIEKLFLLEANAEELHGVDFRKGCYVGQELTSRMKRKAELKKRLLPLAIAGEAAPGANVTADEEILGQVIGGRRGIAFALLRLDRVAAARAAGAPIKIAGTPADLRVPAYLEGRV
ncbi:MAG: folate-binding protein [Alphaproteobacteria bacterium]